MPNLLLIDRDGTLTQNKARPGDYINDPNELELIPGVLERLRAYRDDGWEVAPAAYPSRGPSAIRVGVVDGFESWNACTEFAKQGYRKPCHGMALAAMQWFRVQPTDQILYVGDRPEDGAMAINAGIEFMDAESWRNPPELKVSGLDGATSPWGMW